MQPTYQPNAKLDLSFTRVVNVPRALVWRAWTEPALLMPWFCPMPWKTIDCEIDLRPGGLFRTTMQSPEGAEWPNAGCYLEVVTDRHFNHMRPSIAPQNSLRTTGISSQSHSGALVGSAAAKKVLCRRMISIAPGAPDTGTPRRAPASPLWPVTS